VLTKAEKTILRQLRTRKGGGRWGIGTADTYLREISQCLSGGACSRAFSMNSPAGWETALKAASQRLTYCDPGMVIEKSGGAVSKSPAVPANALMVFDCVITSKKQDRDGDILDPNGAELDPYMPLLWQHIQTEPVGRLIRGLGVSNDRVRGRFAVIDTKLGEDVVKLIEFGALRISHGFRPTKYEPIFSDKHIARDEESFEGYLVHKCEILEGSVVSVPSNTDAAIEGFHKSKFHHPVVKRWAKSLSDARPLVVAVGGITSKLKTAVGEAVENPFVSAEGEEAPLDEVTKGAPCPECAEAGKEECDCHELDTTKGIADGEEEPGSELGSKPGAEPGSKPAAPESPAEVEEPGEAPAKPVVPAKPAAKPPTNPTPPAKPPVKPQELADESAELDEAKAKTYLLTKLLDQPLEEVLLFAKSVNEIAKMRQQQYDDEQWLEVEQALAEL
jgi:hypothetical protein